LRFRWKYALAMKKTGIKLRMMIEGDRSPTPVRRKTAETVAASE